MKRNRFLLKFKETFWFLPTVYGLTAIILTAGLAYTDLWLKPEVFNRIPDFFTVPKTTARSLYTALVTAILTMTAISFSNIMVVLSTYSTQFSPRTLQDFIHSKITQHTLGVFTFGFLVSLLNTWFLNMQAEEVFLSAALTVITAIVNLFAFIFFIHHSARWLQLNFLLDMLHGDAMKIIRNVFKEEKYGQHKDWNQTDLNLLDKQKANIIYSQKSGYIQTLELKSLIPWAKKQNLVLKSEFLLGEYVPAGMPIFYCWNSNGEEQGQDQPIEGNLLLLSNERTDIQDIEFSIEKLMEIALKGISPAVNDPHTTVNAIHRISNLLIELGEKYHPIRYYSDEEGDLRLIMDQRKFSDYLYKSFHLIRHYGKEDVSVMYNCFQALYHTGYMLKGKYDEEIWEFSCYMLEAINTEKLAQLDYQYIKTPIEKIVDLYGKKPIMNR